MTPLFKKLNLGVQTRVVILNAPSTFEPELRSLSGIDVQRDPKKAAQVAFALAFATRQTELDRCSKWLAAVAAPDAVLWFGYPKASSKRHACEFNRDTGWDVIRNLGYDSVRMVAIDEDWSALRFRQVDYIKSVGAKPAAAARRRS